MVLVIIPRVFRSCIEVLDAEACWPWKGVLHDDYPRVKYKGRRGNISVFLYEENYGPVPPGKLVDHTCGHKWCCNPSHYQAITRAQNTLLGHVPRTGRPTKCWICFDIGTIERLPTHEILPCPECIS